MHRSQRLATLLILALLLIACGEAATTPTAAVSSSPRPRASAPRGQAMEHEGTPSPCPSARRVWGGSAGMCGAQEKDGSSGEYYFDLDVRGARFRPAAFALSLSGQIAMANFDNVVHNVTIPASGISMDVEVGAEDFTRPITLEPGRYEFYCRIHRAEGMRGVFTMTANKDLITVRRGY